MRARFLSGLVVLLFLCVPAFAQGEAANARLDGTVEDPNGAAVPGAKVTLANRDTGFTREFNSTEAGQFTFTLIPPGRYELSVEKAGFNIYRQTNIVLAVGQASTLNPRLELGAVTQTVEVEGAAPVLNTGSSDVGSEVSSKQAVELPLNIRNVFGLVQLDSSVNNSQQNQALNPPGSQGNVDQDIAFFNFGGGRFGTTAFLLDGHWDGAGDWDGIIYVPSVDELEEFKIQTNSFSRSTAGAWATWSTPSPNPARAVSMAASSSSSATITSMPTTFSITPKGWPGLSSSAISSASPPVDRCISRASTASATRLSSSAPTKGCASRLPLP